MKKNLPILASIVYFTLIIGVSFNVHYCEGDVKSISVFKDTKDCCCESENNTSCNISSNCCDNKEYLLQFYSDNQLVSSV